MDKTNIGSGEGLSCLLDQGHFAGWYLQSRRLMPLCPTQKTRSAQTFYSQEQTPNCCFVVTQKRY